MENAESILKLADVKKQNLQKIFHQLNAQASTALLCTLKWKDLEDDVQSVKDCLMKQAQALVLRERRVMEMKETVDRRGQELENNLKKAAECLKDIPDMEEKLRSIDLKLRSKEEELSLIQTEIKECNWKLQLKSEEVEKKEEDLEKLMNLIGESNNELESRKKMLDTFCDEIDSKKKELDGIEKSLQESKEQLDLKQRKHNEIEESIHLEQKHLDSIIVLIQESSTELEAKEKAINQHTRELDMNLIEFVCVDKSIKARSEDQCVLIRSKEKELASLQVSIEECKKGHKPLNEQGSSIHFPRPCTSAPTSRSAGNLPGTIFVSEQVQTERPEPIMDPSNPVSSNDQSKDATIASLLTNYHVPSYDLMDHDAIPEFVLGLMLEYYSDPPTGFDESVVRNIVLLLEKLMEVSPTITPQLRKEASKLALAWKRKIRLTADYMMEVLAFLLFLAVYGLASYFERDEILMFAGAVASQKQAPEICQALGFADKMDEFIKNLEMRKQYVEAARFSCVFGLISKFPPEDFFEQHMKSAVMKSSNARHSPEAKCKAIDRQIGAMKSILECVADYKINARVLVSNLKQRRKMKRRSYKLLLSLWFDQERSGVGNILVRIS